MPRSGAVATVVLLTGGSGGIGLNVAVVGRPSDQQDMTLAFRMSVDHIEDLRRVVERVRGDGGKRVWLVGTSRGTTSAAAAAIALGKAVDGLVLTASITDPSLPGAVQNMPLERIRVPVLPMHHRRDMCSSTQPGPVQSVMDALTNVVAKRIVIPTAGGPVSGDACEPRHWHGFAGMDEAAVAEIADFVRNPQPDPP